MKQWPDADTSNAVDSDAQRRAFAAARDEAATGVLVLSDAAGKQFHARCGKCGRVSPTHGDKTQPAIWARHHADTCEGPRSDD